jgi:endonuclease/exonuclease/phosphatase family metal-dependent hydrolase
MRVIRTASVAVALLLGGGCTSEHARSPITLLTLNVASGAGDAYRTQEARARQDSFVASTGAQLFALEEVDLDVQRSHEIDVAKAVAGFDCTVSVPPFTSDGLRRCTGAGGTVSYGRAFEGDDPYDAVNGIPSGIIDDDPSIDPTGTDRSPNAVYGIALVSRVLTGDGYVVELPSNVDQPVGSLQLFSGLAQDPPSADARSQLAVMNETARRGPAVEPRIVLVTRVPREGARTLSVLVTHLESGTEYGALRKNQLARVLAVAQAERVGPPARDIVVLGDFNQVPADSAEQMAAASLIHATPTKDGSGIDQIWVDKSLEIVSGGPISTQGVSDHDFAGLAVVR